MWPLFVSCTPGLERMLAEELGTQGHSDPRAEPGGVALTGDARAVMRINLECGLGAHVLMRVGSFEARHFSALVKHAARLPWSDLLPKGVGWTVRATCRRSKLYHSAAVAQRVDRAIAQALGRENPERGPQIEIAARFDRDTCQLSIDTSGDPLHRRGWRLATAKAPIREDLARALVVASGWDRVSPLVDPLVGSGTIVIEAASMARQLAPGRLRTFAFEHLSLMDKGLWSEVRTTAEADERPESPRIIGRDRVRGALQAATGNAERAGVTDDIEFEHADLREQPLPELEDLVVVTNPPYGHRVQGSGQAFAALAAATTNASRLALVAPVDMHVDIPNRSLRKQLMTDHGGTKVAFFVG